MNSDIEILIVAPFDLLIQYPNELEDYFIENPGLTRIKEILEIKFDTIQWISECYDILAGKRELQKVSLWYSECRQNYFLLDNYFDPTDQLDTITIGIKGKREVATALRSQARQFYDSSGYNLSYCEGVGKVFSKYPIDEASKGRFASVPDKGYLNGKKIEIL